MQKALCWCMRWTSHCRIHCFLLSDGNKTPTHLFVSRYNLILKDLQPGRYLKLWKISMIVLFCDITGMELKRCYFWRTVYVYHTKFSEVDSQQDLKIFYIIIVIFHGICKYCFKLQTRPCCKGKETWSSKSPVWLLVCSQYWLHLHHYTESKQWLPSFISGFLCPS